MERTKRTASKVGNYRAYHLSGDLGEQIQGKVGQLVNSIEVMSTNQELEQELEAQREARKHLEEQEEEFKIRHEMDMERLRAKELELSIRHLKEAREKAESVHTMKVQEMEKAANALQEQADKEAANWVEEHLKKLKATSKTQDPEEEQKRKEEKAKQDKIEELKKQLSELTGEPMEEPTHREPARDQNALMQQLKAALESKPEDPHRDILRALVTDSNKTAGVGGTSTLKPDILARLTGENPHSMQDWLAQLNQQEEGEYLIGREGEEIRGSKTKSGMLDRSTTSIKAKQVWPQKNLAEDWAEEELEFKQLRFEHLVAGETHTIETCPEPAQILGRLRLL